MTMNGSATPVQVPVHQPVVDDREPALRRRLFFFDRIKVLFLLAVFLGLATSQQKNDIALMSWSEALRDQLHAKWWILLLAGLEVIRQVHNFVAERSERWHGFWQKKVFGGWERRISRMNPYTR